MLVTASRRLYLTAPMLEWPRHLPEQLLANSFAFARTIFGENIVEDLAALLAPISNDPVLVREVFEALVRNNVTEDIVNELGIRLGIDVAATKVIADRILPRRR